jgi:hypothetical protein
LRYKATVVVVSNPIDAVNDGPTTAATVYNTNTVQNVTTNDMLNGVLVIQPIPM